MNRITKICHKHGKKPANFLDNDNIIDKRHLVEIKYGRDGYTEIPDELMPEFFLWLDSSTRSAILSGKPWQDIYEELK